MEIFLNNNLVGTASKSFNSFILNDINQSEITIIDLNKINEISIKTKKFQINPLVDNLNVLVNKLKDGEFIFNWDMYEYIPLKYSLIKKENKIFLHSVEIS